MINRNPYFLFFFFAYLVLQVVLLPLSPLPWFDETFFASIARSFAETGRFVPSVAATMFGGADFFMQGPVYYVLSGTVFSFFGFGMVPFRAVALLSGILVCFLMPRFFSGRLGRGIDKPFWLLLLLLLDPFMNLSMHEGRMDTLCLLFFLSSILLVYDRRPGMRDMVFSGVLACLAALTTLRIVALFPVFIVLFWPLGKQNWRYLLVWGLSLSLPYAIWVFYAFEGPVGFLLYYGKVNLGEYSVDSGYIGGNLYVPRHEFFLIGITLVVLGMALHRYGKAVFDRVTIVSLAAIACFYLLVHDLGPYSVFVLPFYYLLLFRHLPDRFGLPLILVLFLFNAGFFVLKASNVFSTLPDRLPARASDFVRENIPSGSYVVGDAVYYYAVVQSGCGFEYMDKFGSAEEREEAQRLGYNYNYAIVSDIERLRYQGAIDLYSAKGGWEVVARMEPLPLGKWASFVSRTGVLSAHERPGYAATIYRKTK